MASHELHGFVDEEEEAPQPQKESIDWDIVCAYRTMRMVKIQDRFSFLFSAAETHGRVVATQKGGREICLSSEVILCVFPFLFQPDLREVATVLSVAIF